MRISFRGLDEKRGWGDGVGGILIAPRSAAQPSTVYSQPIDQGLFACARTGLDSDTHGVINHFSCFNDKIFPGNENNHGSYYVPPPLPLPPNSVSQACFEEVVMKRNVGEKTMRFWVMDFQAEMNSPYV